MYTHNKYVCNVNILTGKAAPTYTILILYYNILYYYTERFAPNILTLQFIRLNALNQTLVYGIFKHT